MGNLRIAEIENAPEYDTIRINKSTKNIKFSIAFFKFRDKDTRQIVIYVPSLELTSYGTTEEKADEMIRFSIDDYFHFLINLSPAQIQKEMSKLGWKHNKIKSKEYSKIFVDPDGNLKNFNAVADEVEVGVLTDL